MSLSLALSIGCVLTVAGWLIALGWQTWLAGTSFVWGLVLQGLIALNDLSYAWNNWQGTLLVIAIIVFSFIFNTVLASRLPLVEGILLILHVAGLFAICKCIVRSVSTNIAETRHLQVFRCG